MAFRVLNRMALALPFLRLDRLAKVIPTFSAKSFSRTFLSAITTSSLSSMDTSTQKQHHNRISISFYSFSIIFYCFLIYSNTLNTARRLLCSLSISGSKKHQTVNTEQMRLNDLMDNAYQPGIVMCMRTTLNMDDQLLFEASDLTVVTEKTALE